MTCFLKIIANLLKICTLILFSSSLLSCGLVDIALIESDAEGIGGSGFVECLREHIHSVSCLFHNVIILWCTVSIIYNSFIHFHQSRSWCFCGFLLQLADYTSHVLLTWCWSHTYTLPSTCHTSGCSTSYFGMIPLYFMSIISCAFLAAGLAVWVDRAAVQRSQGIGL